MEGIVTEAEWLAGTDTRPMLDFLSGRATVRQSLLYACAAAGWLRRTPTTAGADIEAVLTAADRAGDLSDCSGLVRVDSPMSGRFYGRPRPTHPPFVTVGTVVAPDTVLFLLEAMELYHDITAGCHGVVVDVFTRSGAAVEFGEVLCRVLPTPSVGPSRLRAGEPASLLRDIFGNPFSPARVDPSCLTDTVVLLAREMYETRDFSAAPVLADAIQENGCEDADMLNHLRGPGPHCRGCYVVDLVLEKA